jgi:hypothetical protein
VRVGQRDAECRLQEARLVAALDVGRVGRIVLQPCPQFRPVSAWKAHSTTRITAESRQLQLTRAGRLFAQ